MDSVGNLQRRFGLLFTLPGTATALLMTLVASTIPIFTIYLLARSHVASTWLLLIAVSSILTIYGGITLERLLMGRNPIATFRRIVGISMIPLLGWSLVAGVGFLVSQLVGSPEKITGFFLLGMLAAVAIRVLILGSVFFEQLSSAFVVAFLNPLLLIAPLLILVPSSLYLYDHTLEIGGGLILVVAVLLYLFLIGRSGHRVLGSNSLKLLRSFLLAWAEERPDSIEAYMDRFSIPVQVRTRVLGFNNVPLHPSIVIPEVHPGPFHPIGSSNLPHQLHNWFRERGSTALVLHGVAGHEMNLPSRVQVDRLLASLDDLMVVSQGNTCSSPLLTSLGRVTLQGIAFGNDVLVTLTMSPHGMEDFPPTIRKKIEALGAKLDFNMVLVADSHNSQGHPPGEEDLVHVERSAEVLLRRLKEAKQYSFRVGFAHSFEFGNIFGDDVGPGGIGALIFEINGQTYSLIGVDANNALTGLRESMIDYFSNSPTPILEICTSDTHFNAAKTLNAIGYHPLGEATKKDVLAENLQTILHRATERLSNGSFQIRNAEASVKVLGSELLDRFSTAADNAITVARRGGVAIMAISVFVLVVSAISG